ncbi:hypothetical protein AX14_005530 [Amanita brunnescens Koide BX004]|nr:hypothetical protein AX14_005530 [Amanita brunnescens Koide BX004]
MPTMNRPTSSTPLLPERILSAVGHKFLWRSGAIFVAAGMLAGAFGTHSLRSIPGIATESVQAWQTACHYAIYNGLGLLAISMHPQFSAHRFAGPAIIFGGGLFSLSIAAMVLGRDRLRFLGPVTPLGAMLAVAGYISLAL